MLRNIIFNKTYIVLIFLILLSIWVRIHGLALFYYHPDEIMHTTIIRGDSLLDVIKRGLVELHPPLFYIYAYLPFKYFSELEIRRLVSIVPAIFSVAFFFGIGRRFLGVNFAIIFTSIFIFSPISVSLSALIRHYALEMFFMSAALYSLLLNWKNNKLNTIPVAYVVLMLLACSTNFSSFIPACAISFVILVFYLKNGNKRNALKWIIINCLFLFLAAIFFELYFSEHSVGRGWNRSLKSEICAETFIVDSPLNFVLRFFNLLYHFFIPNMYLLAVVTILFFDGLIKLLKYEYQVARVAYSVIFFHLFLAAFSIYPFGGIRYCYFLLPFYSLPIAYSFYRIIIYLGKIMGISDLRVYVATPLLGVLVSYMVAQSSYFIDTKDYSLTKDNYKRAMSYLMENMGTGQIAITNRLSHLYLQFAEDDGKKMYSDSDISSLDFNNTQVYYSNNTFYWTYLTKEYFLSFLKLLNQKLEGQEIPERIWIFNLSHNDYILDTIYSCKHVESFIEDKILIDGFVAYSIDSKFFLKDLLRKPDILTNCLSESVQSVLPDPIKAANF